MLGTVIFDKYSPGAQGKTSDWFTEYAGTDTHTGEKVIVLALHPTLAPLDKLLPRLKASAKKLASLPADFHPAWLQTGKAAEAAVIVCAATDGETLASRMAGSGGLPAENVIELAYRLGKYLEALHGQHLFQGVFDPQEVVFPGPEAAPVVTNPALADFLDLPKLLASGALPNRPHYAPELLTGQPVSARSDLYSLGALLFEALTGKPVTKPDLSPGKTMIVTWLPSRLRRDIPPALDELVATCLHPEPDHRYPGLSHFMAAVNDQRPKAELTPSMLGMEDSLVGQTLGAYRLVERLGQGGMATVYKAYEPALNRYVAIKVLPQFFVNDPNFSVRFRREAKAVAQLTHPNIVPIYSFGESSGITYIAMQYVEGGTLKHERGEKMDYQSALRLLLPITRALGYAHQRGIIHRDVKPSNVLLGEGGWPLLADFGLAKMAEGSSEKLTGTGVGMGTPMYMSPEQGQGVNVDQRSDIYSLGIMLYEFVTGDVPFRADTPMAIVIKHMTAAMPLPRAIDPSIPEGVETIILKATAKNPDDRFASAKDMADAMEAVLTGLPAAPGKAPPPEPPAVPSQPAPVPQGKPIRSRLAGSKKPLRRALFPILGVLGACLLAVILMGIFDICPPQGPWPQPPWCPGSPFHFTSGSTLPSTSISGEVEVFTGFGDPTQSIIADGLDALVRVFNQQYPNLEFLNPITDSSMYPTLLNARLAAGEPPDSWRVHAGQETDTNYAATGQVLPLDDLFASTGLTDALPARALSLISTDGHFYTVPLDIHRSNVLWYNPHVLAAAGVTGDPKKDFRTWDDFFAFCDQVVAAGKICLSLGDPWTAVQLFENVMIGTMGVKKWNGLWTSPPTTDWNGPEVNAGTANFARVLSYTNHDNYTQADWLAPSKMMSDGGAAFNLMGDWVYRYFADADPNGLGLTPHVDFDWANSPGTYGIFVFLSDGFVLPVNAQHPDAATAWLTVVASRAGQEAFNPYKSSICPRTDCDLSLFNEYSQEAASDWISNVLVGSLAHGVVASTDWLASISTAIEVFQTDPTKTSEFRAALVAACQADGTCP